MKTYQIYVKENELSEILNLYPHIKYQLIERDRPYRAIGVRKWQDRNKERLKDYRKRYWERKKKEKTKEKKSDTTRKTKRKSGCH